MNKGEILWQVANGDGPRDNPAIKDLKLGPLGNPGHAAPLVDEDAAVRPAKARTRWSWRDAFRPSMPFDTAAGYGEPWFRAFDKATGEVLAEIELPAGTTGAPMTYLHRGKQYIVVPVGGRDAPPEWVALSLP